MHIVIITPTTTIIISITVDIFADCNTRLQCVKLLVS